MLLLMVYLGLIALGLLAGQWATELISFDIRPSNEAQVHRLVMTAMVVFALAAAIPFVPGAEIGLALVMAFGKPIILLVYAAMVAALALSFMVGRFVPAWAIAGFFDFFGFTRASNLITRITPLEQGQRLELLISRAPTRLVPFLLRHRFIALAAAINLPGNTVLGGGGGIALAAGLSGLFPTFPFLATVALAVAPLPMLIWFTGYTPG